MCCGVSDKKSSQLSFMISEKEWVVHQHFYVFLGTHGASIYAYFENAFWTQQDVLYAVASNSIKVSQPRFWSPEEEIKVTIDDVKFLAPIVLLIKPAGGQN